MTNTNLLSGMVAMKSVEILYKISWMGKSAKGRKDNCFTPFPVAL